MWKGRATRLRRMVDEMDRSLACLYKLVQGNVQMVEIKPLENNILCQELL